MQQRFSRGDRVQIVDPDDPQVNAVGTITAVNTEGGIMYTVSVPDATLPGGAIERLFFDRDLRPLVEAR